MALVGCGPDAAGSLDSRLPGAPTVRAPQLGRGDHSASSVVFTEIASAAAGLRHPRDLAFNPLRPDELWVVNFGDDSMVIVFDASQPTRRAERRKDAMAMHFMPKPSSIAFGAPETTIGKQGTFATCQESRNTYDDQAPPNDFMGPALWSSDLTVFAMQDPFGLGSHLDMLHGSPDCMGLAHERANVYWAFGGKAQTGTSTQRQEPIPAIVRYDFGHDHGVGADDHADGEIAQYVELQVKRVPGIPSHLAFDPASRQLYIADTGNGRVVKLDTTSGTRGAALQAQEPLVSYHRVDGAVLTEVVSQARQEVVTPSGLELFDGLVYVSDPTIGRIAAFTPEGELVNWLDTGLFGALSGMAFGPDGKLYFVDMTGNRVLRVDPVE